MYHRANTQINTGLSEFHKVAPRHQRGAEGGRGGAKIHSAARGGHARGEEGTADGVNARVSRAADRDHAEDAEDAEEARVCARQRARGWPREN